MRTSENALFASNVLVPAGVTCTIPNMHRLLDAHDDQAVAFFQRLSIRPPCTLSTRAHEKKHHQKRHRRELISS